MMNNILHEFIHNGKVICYMDDILVYSCTLSDHQWIVCQILSTLQEQRLFLKPEKCKFEQKEVEYLRLVISKDCIAMDLTKVHCRQDNNPPHESFVESSSRARMSYHNHPKSCLHSIM